MSMPEESPERVSGFKQIIIVQTVVHSDVVSLDGPISVGSEMLQMQSLDQVQ